MKFLLLAVAVLCAKASDVVILTVDNFEEQVCVCILYAYSWKTTNFLIFKEINISILFMCRLRLLLEVEEIG